MLTYICGKSVFSTLRACVVKNALAIQTLKSKTYTTWPFQRLSLPVISRSKSLDKNVCLLFVSTPTSCWSSTRKFPHIFVNLTQTGSLRGLSQFVHGQPVLAAVRTFSTTAHRFSPSRSPHGSSNKTGLIYIIAVFIFMLGGAYAGVPLYKVFCQATGLGGQAVKGHDTDKVETMEPVERPITVRFNADVASSMRWNFKPQQNEVTVNPGETALAFYTAYNPTDKPIIGISTYNVLPFDAGQYFNKIQCFCFEEQRLNPKEQVDMPVFFYIDPEFAEDPKLEHVDIITLSYTFFEAREGLVLPLPGYPQPHNSPAVAAS